MAEQSAEFSQVKGNWSERQIRSHLAEGRGSYGVSMTHTKLV